MPPGDGDLVDWIKVFDVLGIIACVGLLLLLGHVTCVEGQVRLGLTL